MEDQGTEAVMPHIFGSSSFWRPDFKHVINPDDAADRSRIELLPGPTALTMFILGDHEGRNLFLVEVPDAELRAAREGVVEKYWRASLQQPGESQEDAVGGDRG